MSRREVRLAALLQAAGLPASPSDAVVTEVTCDSRSCGPGSLFVAVPGFHVDGHDYAAAAVARGAVAVVSEHPLDTGSVLDIVVPNSRVALAALACAFFDNPSREMLVAGVTGTDGKTTTTTMLWSAWRAGGLRAASLTTVDWRTGDDVVANKSRQTTLEAPELQRHLASLRDTGVSHVALETSSHALELHRVDGVAYRVAVYTRITSEHLELHGSRDAYLAAKRRLVEMVSGRSDGVAVLDATDDFGYPSLAAVPVAQRITYSIDPAVGADLTADAVRAEPGGIRFAATTPWGGAEVQLKLGGRFNVANALAAMAAACATGVTLEQAASGVAALQRVPGRMESVDLGQPFSVVVDYAHTAESLATVLRELRPATTGRLIAVFGSAGERDREKRPAMGAAAAVLADITIITDEDPRDEDRERILEEIAAGATDAGGRRGENVVVVPDRRQAIDFAVRHARTGDTVVFAGKGHEGSIITAAGAEPWDERAIVEAAIARLWPSVSGHGARPERRR
ncbi:MAG: UDP-N-acetylmuramoyl-L-alanyl-D-glutamate--2,6-diaminopimelate ligase [Candidatus Dormibacteraeota bacterium]|nr:UDP-N-acetylmuramoyl-L-alanyl-D-glutamate--2,6-diaminopimelate ligase [Candidatus Dormibacteraeota bacterium]